MSRPNPLAKPEFAKQVAEAFVAGLTRAEMCELFGVRDKDTITRWRRDPRVQAIAKKLMQDRVIQINRRLDARIEAILQHHLEDLSVKEIVMLRKEMVGGALRAEAEKADEQTIAEAGDFLEKNPDAADQLKELLETGQIAGSPPPEPAEV